jgi:6-phosphogluconolactonase (cycloisomerase 2 family)
MFSTKLTRAAAVASALLLSCSLALADSGRGHRRSGGTLFTTTNSVDGNRVLVFDRSPSGALKLAESFPTGGFGTGAGLGNQGGIVLTPNGDWLLTVNAASAEVSLFEVVDDVLVLRDIVPSGGAVPLSVAVDHNLVYVLNGGDAGSPNNITGFTLSASAGRLTALPGSTRALSGDAVAPAQISFSPWGGVLVVTEKGTNMITTFTVGDDGLASNANPQPSSGMTPFGFAFDRNGRLFVSEAFGGALDASAMSSYAVSGSGILTTISPTVPTHQTAACWVALDLTGRFAYTTNTGSSSISGYRIAPAGAISPLDADGVTASTGAGSSPIDVALTKDGRFLYALSGGANTITGFRVRGDGSLDPVETEGDLPIGTNGLAAR